MIYDTIDNIKTYLGINKNLDRAIMAIIDGKYLNWDPGKYEVCGKDVFCNVVHLETRSDSKWERHEAYLDIHVIIRGNEVIRFASKDQIQGWSEFDIDNDSSLASYTGEGVDFPLEAGWFVVVFPQDAHMPGLKSKDTFSDKAIFKAYI